MTCMQICNSVAAAGIAASMFSTEKKKRKISHSFFFSAEKLP
jgi:hypothetical protein